MKSLSRNQKGISRYKVKIDFPVWKLGNSGGETISEHEVIQEMMHSPTLLTPPANPDLCTACGTCVDHCSVSVLSMNHDIPEVEDETCIRCLCCQEIYPETAIALK